MILLQYKIYVYNVFIIKRNACAVILRRLATSWPPEARVTFQSRPVAGTSKEARRNSGGNTPDLFDREVKELLQH